MTPIQSIRKGSVQITVDWPIDSYHRAMVHMYISVMQCSPYLSIFKSQLLYFLTKQLPIISVHIQFLFSYISVTITTIEPHCQTLHLRICHYILKPAPSPTRIIIYNVSKSFIRRYSCLKGTR